MLAKVIIENGVKKIQALTADTGTGAPVGSYLYLEKKSNPQGYLYCDGSTFDETVYPALYQYLGTNVLPDWRELGAKGAEKNTTLIFDSTETDPSTGQAGTQNHDVFTQGEFKDDQLQDHKHSMNSNSANVYASGSANNGYFYSSSPDAKTAETTDCRAGTVTRGKSRAVFIYIKATSGLTENQQENVLNTINENNSYSTTEHPTGKKWIDGKPIYRKVVDCGSMPNATTKTISNVLSNIDYVISIQGSASNGSVILPLPYPTTEASNNDSIQVYISDNKTSLNFICKADLSMYLGYVTLEYTKTTD